MIPYFATTIIATVFVLCAYHLGNGNTGANLLSGFALVTLICWLLPELQGLPVPVYMFAGILVFVGLQVVLPIAEGKPYLWAWRTQRFMVAVAVAG